MSPQREQEPALPPMDGIARVLPANEERLTPGLSDRPAGEAIFLVGGSGLGAQASRAEVEMLRAGGVAAVLGRSFRPGFRDVAGDAGLPALIVEETTAVRDGDRLRIDIEDHVVVNRSAGNRYPIRNMYDEELERLRDRWWQEAE